MTAAARAVAAPRPAARDALAAAFPAPEADPAAARAVVALAKAVHAALEKVTGRKVPFPETYDAAARDRLARAWK
jgi:hypothetical protein